MTARAKMEVDFEDFVMTGTFGVLKLGMSKHQIMHKIFSQEDWSDEKKRETSPIWTCGSFDFHFNEENQLDSIFTDYVRKLNGGENLDIINWWIIPNNQHGPTLERTLNELNSMNLDYTKLYVSPGYLKLALKNGVYFLFDHPDGKAEENQNNWTMTAIAVETDFKPY